MGKNPNICVTCLSSKRELASLHKIKHFLEDIKFPEINSYNSAICWECRSIVMKFYKFKTQALEAHKTLYNKVKKTNMKSLSYLQIKVNKHYDYEFCHIDPLKSCDNEIKTKKEIKDEIEERMDFMNTDDDLTDINDVQTENTKMENINIAAIKAKKNNLKKTDIDKKEIEGKFVQIVFTEEEMIKNREDKRSHHNFKKIPYKCDSCVLGFTRKETYEEHVLRKHDERKGSILCDVCQIRFTTESAMTTHRWRHYVCYKCKLCKYSTTELWSVGNHCKIKHMRDNVNSIHCGQCVAVFITPEKLEEHIQTTHTIHCDECGVKFKGKDNLRRHKAYPCPECNKKFVSKVYWSQHYKFYHLRKSQYKCDLCNKLFISDWRLKNHKQIHHGLSRTRDHHCNVCGKEFFTISSLRNHNLTHSDQRSYMCEDCGDTFKQRAALYTHCKLVHGGQKKISAKYELNSQTVGSVPLLLSKNDIINNG